MIPPWVARSEPIAARSEVSSRCIIVVGRPEIEWFSGPAVQRETMNFSAEFANLLIPELGKEGRLLRKTHRFAGFRVLKAPDVPSVLVEMGYVSNRKDERMLRDPARRRDLMRAVVRAVDRYFALRKSADRT